MDFITRLFSPSQKTDDELRPIRSLAVMGGSLYIATAVAGALFGSMNQKATLMCGAFGATMLVGAHQKIIGLIVLPLLAHTGVLFATNQIQFDYRVYFHVNLNEILAAFYREMTRVVP